MWVSTYKPVHRHFLWIFIALNCSVTLWRARPVVWPTKEPMQKLEAHHSYVGSDYPMELPVGNLDLVSMTLQESVHYSLNFSDPVSDMEWRSMPNSIGGFGRTRLGPDYRLFVVTLHHQLHCLRYIQLALFSRVDPEATPHHVQHCLNYLRQTFLCEAGDMLEAGDFMERDFEVDRVGETLVCQDWQKVYDDLDERFEDWLTWKSNWD